MGLENPANENVQDWLSTKTTAITFYPLGEFNQ